MKTSGSTTGLHLKLFFLSDGEAGGIPCVAVKCVDARSLVHEAHKALGGLDIMALVAGKQVAMSLLNVGSCRFRV